MKTAGKTPKDDNWKARYEEPVGADTSKLPDPPQGWCWATVDQLCAEVTDGDHQPPPVSDSGVPFLVIGDVRTGKLDFSGCRTVPSAYYDSLASKRKPGANDLLYTVVGSFGIPVRVAGTRPFCVQRHIAILKSPSAAMKDYLFVALSSDWVFHQAVKAATGTAQKTVGLGPLRRIAIPVPPSPEAVRVADEAARLLSHAEEASDAVAADLTRVTRLRQAVLKWAFEGKLADQDPHDQPAEKLLDRVRAERAAVTPAQHANGRRRKGAA
jgi:type I restriction enzyme S subunit